MYNAMTTALLRAKTNHTAFEFYLQVVDRIAKKQPKFKEGFSTKLSYRTYQALKAQGIVE
jgi:hypothetical protein